MVEVLTMPRHLTRKEIARLAGVGVSTIKRWCRSGDFPRPIVDRYRTQRWDPEAVRQWLRREDEEAMREA